MHHSRLEYKDHVYINMKTKRSLCLTSGFALLFFSKSFFEGGRRVELFKRGGDLIHCWCYSYLARS